MDLEKLEIFKQRFENNMSRHKNIIWEDVEKKLLNTPNKLFSLYRMEETGGEPDVISYDEKTKQFVICDCSPESPIGRRSLCYDKKALDNRKNNKPNNSVIELAKEMGIDVLTEHQYSELQKLGPFDQKTSSWIITPDKIRKLGGALFCDFRYGKVFIYHNGAESYYSSRGFRGCLKI